MKFKLVSSGSENLDRYQSVLDTYNVKVTDTGEESLMGEIIKDYEVDITSLEHLMSFIKDIKSPVIVFEDYDGEGRTLEIYDYFRE